MWVKSEWLDTGVRKIRTVAVMNVVRVPEFGSTPRILSAGDGRPAHAPKMGVLENVERYFIYRVALYADGFQQSKSTRQSKSVGGVYLLPLGLPPALRNSAKSVRPLCLTPHGLPANDALNMVMEDLRVGATTGVIGTDPFGRPVRIFVDVLALYGDLPQAAAYSDVLGHSATTFCNLCFMRKRKDTPLPTMNYSGHMHSLRLGFARFDERRLAIRAADFNKHTLRAIGMRRTQYWHTTDLPAVVLSETLRQATPRFKTKNGLPPVPLVFDHALSIPAVPDHVVSGLVAYLMNACFNSLEDDNTRRYMEAKIVSAANENGLEVRRHILTWVKKGSDTKYTGVASNSMTAWMCILLVSGPIFKDYNTDKNRAVFKLPALLQDVVTALYKWPSRVVSGTDAPPWKFSSHFDQLQYQDVLIKRTVKFLSTARAMYNEDPVVGSLLDKPIVHRLLELVMHTVPLYGHARMCSEMVLEQAHQQFKSWLQKTTHPTVHLTAMDKAIARDWLWRLCALHETWKTTTGGCNRPVHVRTCVIRLKWDFDAFYLGKLGWRMTTLLAAGFASRLTCAPRFRVP